MQTYEQILQLEERDGATMGFIFSKPNTAVFTYTPSESGTYTVTVSSSSFYCDIYVIDPRSAETIVHGEDYQMSYGGNRNVTLDIELDAGITYLIIPSSSAPSLLQGSQMGVVSVVKKED